MGFTSVVVAALVETVLPLTNVRAAGGRGSREWRRGASARPRRGATAGWCSGFEPGLNRPQSNLGAALLEPTLSCTGLASPLARLRLKKSRASLRRRLLDADTPKPEATTCRIRMAAPLPMRKSESGDPSERTAASPSWSMGTTRSRRCSTGAFGRRARRCYGAFIGPRCALVARDVADAVHNGAVHGSASKSRRRLAWECSNHMNSNATATRLATATIGATYHFQ